MITFVYTQDEHGAIGFKQDLPWYLPSDLKHFKETTMGHTMVMGRKTFESMGKRLLPGRKSVVVTNQADYGADIPELMVLHNIEDVLELGKNQELMVIGGAGLYESLWPHVDKIARTVIYDTFEADTFIPEIDKSKFELVKVVHGVVDEKNVHARDYEWWKRKEGATK